MLSLLSMMWEFVVDHWSQIGAFVSGSAITAWGLWRDRIRLTTVFLGEPFDLEGVRQIKVETRFELENLGARITSINREVRFTGWTPVERTRFVETLTIEKREQRILRPCEPVEVTARNENVAAVYVFCWYQTYTFSPTRGPRVKIRFRHAGKERLGFVRFHLELAAYRWLGWTAKSA